MTIIKPWQILSSSITYQDEWLTLRADRCKAPRGRIIDPFHIVEASDWVNVVALTDRGDVVLIREYRHGAQAVLLGIPGGVCDEADASPLDAAARELAEETGFACRELVHTGSAYSNCANHTNEIHYFLGFGAELTGRTNFDANEDIEVQLKPYKDFATYDFDGVKHTHHAAALFYAERYFKLHPDQKPGEET
ncbi:MAG: NUDIX hydrolase [Pseudomonadota bacterium]